MILGATDTGTDEGATDDVSRLSDDDEGATEEIKAFFLIQNTVFKLQGKTKGPNKLKVTDLKRKLYGLVVEKDVDYFEKRVQNQRELRLISYLTNTF
jgi:hypothetical protein